MSYNFKRDCRNIYLHTKTPKQRGGCMPYDTGHLARAAYFKRNYGDNLCILTINCQHNQMGAPYAVPLNTGSVPHDIPNAFGVYKRTGYPLGIGGRFDGKFHPGSKKHIGFFDNADDPNSILGYTLNYFVKHYGGVIKHE